jgi:hypothetical protein
MFIPATAHLNRPVLLIMDGHNAHINLNIINLMKQHNIVCLILPPHCTHSLQPIDVVLFNNVKIDWCARGNKRTSVLPKYKSTEKYQKYEEVPRSTKKYEEVQEVQKSTTRTM